MDLKAWLRGTVLQRVPRTNDPAPSFLGSRGMWKYSSFLSMLEKTVALGRLA